jgi:hypothetical protein
MTEIPYGRAGAMLGLRSDHDAEDYGECRLCSPLPAREDFWQRGCPTTGLPMAPVWRPRSSTDETAVAAPAVVDAIASARRAVARAQQRVAARQRATHTARSGQLVGWQVDNQATVQRPEYADHHAAPVLTADGAA